MRKTNPKRTRNEPRKEPVFGKTNWGYCADFSLSRREAHKWAGMHVVTQFGERSPSSGDEGWPNAGAVSKTADVLHHPLAPPRLMSGILANCATTGTLFSLRVQGAFSIIDNLLRARSLPRLTRGAGFACRQPTACDRPLTTGNGKLPT